MTTTQTTRAADIKRAYRLWKGYKTETREYREIAERLYLSTAELNQRCWHINHAKCKAAGKLY